MLKVLKKFFGFWWIFRILMLWTKIFSQWLSQVYYPVKYQKGGWPPSRRFLENGFFRSPCWSSWFLEKIVVLYLHLAKAEGEPRTISITLQLVLQLTRLFPVWLDFDFDPPTIIILVWLWLWPILTLTHQFVL